MSMGATSRVSSGVAPARPSLRYLRDWAYHHWTLETPNLEHSVSLTDEGGVPRMKASAAAWLGLTGRGHPAWRREDGRDDGALLTPLRAALTRVGDPWLRLFLRDLVPERLNPSLVCRVHGIPKPVEAWVMRAALDMLYQGYLRLMDEERYGRVSWIDVSESQRNAVIAGEAA